ncbi:PREDICTED: 1-phosphatidylinositol 4,5-bisphosphate phosphodiesterase-like isoform X1 [Dinoponera quadriceps]|uniref:1-phosphatidylinositol 4,5-bisphosphate phosphodiesterase n=1 Tax=Dinoponera quadriceps TaxID=609295 RepID=A0A6P3WQ17_DINQU|nr:PREDICTED: 1-phosphatidylinositol 4,5-bisphosphate phosphodiesterase-like isoform X1 [Dinoponera quadriceps]XP_014467959.1 PREDICTED: 1-phosphatidylinositol 4,5-bisphosphate phosphodiesterase-like isoform X1 [Dinoponera quadriceps]XP_014467960.1 PREDICTED: 1-phosphatidylinositol 4,5-bisphosphate phosphodiesterase-like isoform X1 [Dinoponera quadriceps]XP_014467961.1 PREDICTED: 1-phosphatidylinositol 4,5-bisphosphate phosphodiesterase-like isoform X1 [Dinoponera quadriceps]XP_014467962.1 PRED
MTKKFEFNWQIEVPEVLRSGCVFDRWTEEKDNTEIELNCLFKVDEYGFFIYWQSEGKDGDVVELCQVSDIRAGGIPKDPKLYDKLFSKHGEQLDEKSLTICSGVDYTNINYQHVVCPDSATAKVWLDGVRSITHNVKANNVCPLTCLKKHWMRLRMLVDPNGKVPVKVVARTFASGKTEKLVYQCLSDLGLPSGKNDVIEPDDFTFDAFYALYHKICPRNDIEELFQSITQGKADTINLEQLITFLNEKQRDPTLNEILYPLYDEKRAMEIINDYEQNEVARNERTMTKDGFIRYLMSDENAPVFLDRLDVYMDMDQSLAHYYINSSHNTYLSGRQFGGKSSVEMYRQVLLAGCRCVELDCWDGKGEDEEPIITHGKAMCTDILFKDVIYAVRDTAFVTSEYPVILSFENHCSKKQQYKLAKYCDEILGDLLLKEPLKEYPLELGVPLPPPSMLKRKILIKNKRLKPEVEKQELELFKQGQFVIEDEVKEDSSAPPSVAAVVEQQPVKEDNSGVDSVTSAVAGIQQQQSGSGPGLGESIELAAALPYTGSTTNVHPWLSSMVNYAQPVKFAGFDVAEQKNLHHNMSSFAETAGLNYLKTSAIEFVNYNKRQMSRIYPKGTRADSSNYMPQVFWNAGCQMVSLNFQTADLPMQLNQGKFEYNGSSGYLLKPDFMRRADRSFDPFAESPVDGVIATQCSVQVIAGQFLSDKKVGTYVEVEMYGLPTDTIRKEFRTRVVPANGLNPVYNEEPFLFRKVVLPDLAALRFAVYDESNGKLLGQRIVPLDGLQAGYRHIALRTEANFPMSLPMLFCNIDIKIYVPDGFQEFMDALTAPRAFRKTESMSQNKMRGLGIEESDSKNNMDAVAPHHHEAAKPREEMKFDPITLDTLRHEKGYQKVLRKQQKELESLRKRHHKEKLTVQKQHCVAIEKIIKGKNKAEISRDSIVRRAVTEQTAQWSRLADRQRREERDLVRGHLEERRAQVCKLCGTAQLAQQKQLTARHEREIKDMNARQARLSVESMREVMNDKTLKSRGIKEGRLREKQQNNTKKFMEERKVAQMIQNREKEKLKVIHEKQLEELQKDMNAIMDMYKDEEMELEPKTEFYV